MGEWPEAGTPVKVAVKTWSGVVEHEGLALPAAGPKLITLKLTNGYNVSYPESYVESVEILDEVEISEEEAPTPIQQDENLPLVHLIHTGGTIAAKVDYATGAVTARFEPDELLKSIPELKSVARLRVVKLGNMWSDDIRPRHWNRMLKATEEAFAEGAVGVVITHGTDTLHLSAAAMGYGWAGNGGRPPGRIALTGSQRSPDRGSSDAAENIVAAVHWAAHGPEPTGYRDASVVVMHSESSDGQCAVLPGIACRKYHSSRRDAFKAINQGPLAWINNDGTGPSIEMAEHEPADARVEAISPMMFDEDARIAQFIADPHLDPNLVMLAIKDDFDAIVLHGTGLGHLPISDPQDDSPENTKLRLMLEDHCANDGVVVVVAQTIHGPMNMNVYAKGREQQEIGIIGHGSLCPPGSALVKLHHLLSRGGGRETVASNWTEDLCGENPHDSMD